MAVGKRSPVLLKALPLGDKLVVSWLALGRPAQPQVLELDEARFVAGDPSSGAHSRTACLYTGSLAHCCGIQHRQAIQAPDKLIRQLALDNTHK